jgi:aspartyl-tRNA(Asn)/glutamyl-tRNA(Gln) amidotransferase subunit A
MSAATPGGSALEIARRIRSGETSAAAVLAETRACIEARDGALNCFTARTFERAQREADAIDARRAGGESLPALAGVPYAVKNLFDVEGLTTLAGAKVNAHAPAAVADAYVVKRMREAGAVLVGALNMDEHAYGFTCENTHYGATLNPHDLGRVSGGSSGGSAAAVGAGIVPLTLGSDTSGSIRVPASFCGIFGLKPTYGRLSRSGCFPFVDSLDHVGPFARTAGDLAAAYNALQGKDAHDHACAQRDVEIAGIMPELPPGTRIGILGGWFQDWAGPAAQRVVQMAAAALGATQWCELQGAAQARAAAFIITGAEGGALHRLKLQARYEEFEPASRDRLVAGSLIPASWVIRAQQARRRVYSEALELFGRFDLLLAPAAPDIAPQLGSETFTINGRTVPTRATLGILTQPISCIGLPACAAPLWPDGDDGAVPEGGLPVGVQLIAAPWREDLCLAAAAHLERAGVARTRLPTMSGE